jgi:SAM-dependent methyltransferase
LISNALISSAVVVEANREQAAYWNEQAGPVWATHQERLDRQIGPLGERLLAALALEPGERVLDVGCGCGGSTLAIARRVGPHGRVVGVDLSEPMLARARERIGAEALAHVDLVRADAQSADLGESRFDAIASRFGVMFFDDPVAAFRNLLRALRPGGRAAFLCWQSPQTNPWVVVPMAAVAAHLPLPPPPPAGTPGMFALADATRVRTILEQAGFADVTLEDLRLPLRLADDAADLFLEVGPVAALLRERDADAALRDAVRGALRDALAAHVVEGRLELGSATWLATARR